MHLSTAYSLIKMSYLHLNNFSIFSGTPPPKKKSHLNDYSLKKKKKKNLITIFQWSFISKKTLWQSIEHIKAKHSTLLSDLCLFRPLAVQWFCCLDRQVHGYLKVHTVNVMVRKSCIRYTCRVWTYLPRFKVMGSQ